ncbi:DEAD/DEAH box helicase [Micromonospora craterilacus]|uniref:DEAD/DEAH box helicase n=1 Tax=Micromonospora craterilacus TaxID=1655439 RepID=UPI00131403F9|nr:DEAD/DEAH box helicase [Micromonospora craterilacus]
MPFSPNTTRVTLAVADVTARPSAGVAHGLLEPAGWQRVAIPAAVAALRGGGRGQIHAACGTGKTVTAAHLAVELCPAGGLVVVACPTVTLVSQTLAVFASVATTVLAVCGDDGVTDAAVRAADLPAAVTTDVGAIGEWLRQPCDGIRLVVTTHRSAGVLAVALTTGHVPADLLVIDEAHHSAGAHHKHVAVLHDDATFPARRRLYLTATPRGGDMDDETILSMADPAVFGPVLYRYTFAQAIADGWLDDYRIAVVGVTRAEVLPLVRSLTGTRGLGAEEDGPLRNAMLVAACARAAVEFDLRRTIVYAPRIATSRAFATAFPDILAALPPNARPGTEVTCHHVDGRHNAVDRSAFLADLAHPPHGGWTVLTNVRCLGEGVDVPAVDSVVFTHPKGSAVEVVQAVGRALRRNLAGTGTATILIPVLVGDDTHVDAQADADGYHALWQVVRAMRAHDENLAIALDDQRQRLASTPSLPEKIVVRLPDGYDIDQYLRHITVRLVTATTSPWWEGYGAAACYHAFHGHLHLTVDHVTDDGYPLGRWIHHQRKARRAGHLPPERVQALDTLAMLWDPRASRWERGFVHAAAYRSRLGHLRVPPDHVTTDGFPLGTWIREQRKQRKAGRLDPVRTAALERLGIEWDPYQAMWDRGITHAVAFHAQHGHLRVLHDHTCDDGYRLGQFIVAQRMLRKRGTLTPDRIAQLDALGMMWDIREHTFTTGLHHARAYVDLHGTLCVSISTHTRDGYHLGRWLSKLRAKLRAGTLPPEWAVALDAISTTWRAVANPRQR